MLPTGHVEFTWAGLNLIQRQFHRFEDADYRLATVAALLPDLIDKPLAIFVLRDAHAALLYGHTLVFHATVWAVAGATGRLRRWLPYLLAFSGHLLADRMWGFTQTLFWPFTGWRFHQWEFVGSPNAIWHAYLRIVVEEPKLIIFEVVGLGLLIGFARDRGLTDFHSLMLFLRTGRPGRPDQERIQQSQPISGSIPVGRPVVHSVPAQSDHPVEDC
ncbi:MAG TPA: metal-dependent hydrolase [Anaerolineae bacterium]|nr:metal-dependent hydrolase [Anaerolineae bacterium]HIQ05598.1 metal-dependent hydrolase [Anaerolineae bacterium]